MRWGVLLGGLFVLAHAYGQTPRCRTTASLDEGVRNRLEAATGSVQLRNAVTVPVVFHVLHHSADPTLDQRAVERQLATLNRAFAGEDEHLPDLPPEFRHLRADGAPALRFCLATRADGSPAILRQAVSDPNFGLTDRYHHDDHGGSTPWDARRYLNVWVVDLGGALAGFGTYPQDTLPPHDGVTVDPDFFGDNDSPQYGFGKVLVHEVGHYFGLDHPWGSCSGTDDGIADTPPQAAPHYGCPTHPAVSCGSSDLFQNYMDYTDDGCMMLFTEQQMERMIAAQRLYRAELGRDAACLAIASAPEVVRLFPNPARGAFVTVELPAGEELPDRLDLFDATGRQWVVRQQETAPGAWRLFTGELPAGMYFLRWAERSVRLVLLRG